MATIYLLKDVDLDNTYEHTLDFDNEQVQVEYFASKKFTQVTVNVGFSYLRENLPITVEIPKDELFGCNYLMYSNESTGKWYYAFINKKDYVNETCTRLTIETDVMQTFMFDYEFVESFIDREHQDQWDANNKPIYNIVPENLEIGNAYNVKDTKKYIVDDGSDSSESVWYIVKCKEPLGKFGQGLTYNAVDHWSNMPYESSTETQTTRENDVDTGLYVYIAPKKLIFTIYINDPSHRMNGFYLPGSVFENPNVVSITPVRYIKRLSYYLSPSHPESRNTVLFEDDGDVSNEITRFQIASVGDPANGHYVVYVQKYGKYDFDIEYNETIEPSLNIENEKSILNEPKLLTAPYNFIRLNYGNEYQNYNREYFSNGIKFGAILSLGYNGGINVVPKNYNNVAHDNFSLMQPKNVCNISLRTDQWQSYLLQNKASLNGGLVVKGVQTALSLGLGLATGGIGLAVAGTRALGYGASVAEEMIKRQNIKAEPDDIRPNVDDTEMINMLTDLALKIDIMEIKPEFKKRVFDFFYHYGYKCNDIKIPNTRSRYYFNYIKTIGCELKSNVDTQYIQMIKNIYDKGITIWHYRDANTFKGIGNYEYENVQMNKIGE